MDFCDGIMYSIKQGDTLYSISMKYKVPLALLLRANPYVDVYNLQVGETICIPTKRKNPQHPYWYPKGYAYSDETEGEQMENMETVTEENQMTEQQNMSSGMQEAAEPKVVRLPAMDRVSAQNRQDEEDDEDNDTVVQWKRYVTKPGDTLLMAVRGDGEASEEEVEDFIEKNGAGRIYLLPGIAYYTRM